MSVEFAEIPGGAPPTAASAVGETVRNIPRGGVDATQEARGLSSAEAAERLSRLGPNALPEPAPDPLWRRFGRQFESPLIYILLFALAFNLSLWLYKGVHGWPNEAGAIGLILLFNATLRLYQLDACDGRGARRLGTGRDDREIHVAG